MFHSCHYVTGGLGAVACPVATRSTSRHEVRSGKHRPCNAGWPRATHLPGSRREGGDSAAHRSGRSAPIASVTSSVDPRSYDTISVRFTNGACWITLNRPERANAVNSRLAAEVISVLTSLAQDSRVRVVVLTGTGSVFCGGADLRSRVEDESANGIHPVMTLCDAVERLEIPVIAAVNGPAMGGGCELVLACDLRVMAEDAEIGVPEIRFGVMPRAGGTQRLPRQIGVVKAKEMILTGLPITAAEALSVGLVNQVVPADQLLAASNRLARTLAERPRYALSAAKFAIDAGLEGSLASGLAIEARTLRTMASAKRKASERARAAAAEGVYRRIFRDGDAAR
jgi:enoyl-CoA hydratase